MEHPTTTPSNRSNEQKANEIVRRINEETEQTASVSNTGNDIWLESDGLVSECVSSSVIDILSEFDVELYVTSDRRIKILWV
jgi:hypothetical protein